MQILGCKDGDKELCESPGSFWQLYYLVLKIIICHNPMNLIIIYFSIAPKKTYIHFFVLCLEKKKNQCLIHHKFFFFQRTKHTIIHDTYSIFMTCSNRSSMRVPAHLDNGEERLRVILRVLQNVICKVNKQKWQKCPWWVRERPLGRMWWPFFLCVKDNTYAAAASSHCRWHLCSSL